MSVLVQVSERGLGRKFALNDACVIGRNAEADLQVVDGLVCKRNAAITRKGIFRPTLDTKIKDFGIDFFESEE